MKCPRTQSECYNPDCGKTTGICAVYYNYTPHPESIQDESSTPVTGESEGERKFTLKEVREAFCHTYNVGKAFPGNNKNKDEKQYFKQTFGIDI